MLYLSPHLNGEGEAIWRWSLRSSIEKYLVSSDAREAIIANLSVFLVDSGRRESLNPNKALHILPEKYYNK